jgi:AcrR family transcriptional regulator
VARPNEFDKNEALEAAIEVFREHGFAGTSTGVLTEAMNVGLKMIDWCPLSRALKALRGRCYAVC